MRKLTMVIWIMTGTTCLHAQDKDSTTQNLDRIVDSAFKELSIAKSFEEQPDFDYFIVKIRLMNGAEKRAPFCMVHGSELYTYSAVDRENLDTTHAVDIRHISFRKYKRTASMVAIGVGTGVIAGGATGAALYDCSNCDGDDFHIEQVWWGLGGGTAGAIVGAVGGLAVAAFNNGGFHIKGNPEKLRKLNQKINRFAVKKNRPR